MLGVKPAGDASLGSKGTLFTPSPGSGCCWAGSGPPRGLLSHGYQGLNLPEASSRIQDEAPWIPVGSPGHTNTHPDNTAVVQGLRPRCLIPVSGVGADCGQRGLGHLFQVQQVPSDNH